MTPGHHVVRSVADAPWLPPGGRADVVRTPGGGRCPEPTGLARLLVERDGAVFCVPRDGSGRPDLPTVRVAAEESGQQAAERLAAAVLAGHADLTLVGYVRNTVSTTAADYPWPTPFAYFAVFRAAISAVRVPGTWVPREAPGDLVERHWWPLVATPTT
ncbi:hypothetical protein IU11_16365 [Cellulosimicrobium sp. MM]|nr:hypothetical protein IU11_16365 [Cellulosimicrobium sp. MM]